MNSHRSQKSEELHSPLGSLKLLLRNKNYQKCRENVFSAPFVKKPNRSMKVITELSKEAKNGKDFNGKFENPLRMINFRSDEVKTAKPCNFTFIMQNFHRFLDIVQNERDYVTACGKLQMKIVRKIFGQLPQEKIGR